MRKNCYRNLFAVATLIVSGGTFPQDNSLSNILTSSAWCSMSYDKSTNTVRQARAVFSNNGSYRMERHGEGFLSTSESALLGDMTVQGTWKAANGTLLLATAGRFEQVDFQLTMSANGLPILLMDGKDFARCD
jgi:hypothetical protein